MIRFFRAILSNIFSLALALFVAILIWINATQGNDPLQTQSLQIEVEFIGLPENGLLISPSRQTVQVGFEAPSSIVTTLSDDDFIATANLSNVTFGQDTFVDIQIQNPNNVSILFQSPIEVPVLVDESVSREIPLELRLTGTAARGYEVDRTIIEPEFINVVGPASRVNELSVARATLSLNNQRETIIGNAIPIFYDRSDRATSTAGIQLDTDLVTITVALNESANFAEKFVNLNVIGQPASGYRLLNTEIDPETVLVRGAPSALNALTLAETEQINITGLTSSFTQQVSLELPDGITLDQGQSLFVTVEIEPIFDTANFKLTPTTIGLDPPKELVEKLESVSFVLYGPVPTLASLSEEDLQVTVDLTDLPTGSHLVEPMVIVPTDLDLEVRAIQPELLSVQITSPVTITTIITPNQATLEKGIYQEHEPQASQTQLAFQGRDAYYLWFAWQQKPNQPWLVEQILPL